MSDIWVDSQLKSTHSLLMEETWSSVRYRTRNVEIPSVALTTDGQVILLSFITQFLLIAILRMGAKSGTSASLYFVVLMMCFLIFVILYCSDKPFPPNCWNHVGSESKVLPDGFPQLFRRAFSSGVAIPKQSYSAGVSSYFTPYPTVLRGAMISAWSRRSLDRSSVMSGAGVVG